MSTTTRTTDWRSIVIACDPDWPRDSRYVIEYEFSAAAPGDETTHEGTMRVFRGYYDLRGPYAPE
jgi:hypothetical protein